MMRNKRGFSLVGEEVVRAVVGVMSLIVLIGLLIALYFMFSVGDESKAEAELRELRQYLNDLKNGEKVDYPVTHAPEWFLFSSEKGNLCVDKDKADFCLCLCEKSDCVSDRACVGTDKFVSLRSRTAGYVDVGGGLKNYEVTRSFRLSGQKPVVIDLELKEGEVYPFNSAGNPNWDSIRYVHPIYFRYNGRWEWSKDLEEDGWKSLTSLSSLSSENQNENRDFIESILKKEIEENRGNEEEAIKEFFEKRRAALISEGVYIIRGDGISPRIGEKLPEIHT